MKADA